MARQAIGSRRSGTRAKRSGGKRVPERVVERQVRAEREKNGNHRGEREEDGQAALPPHGPEACEREERSEPAEKDVLLDPRSDTAAEEVGELGRVVPHLGERAPAVRDRAGDDDPLHGDRRHRARSGCGAGLPPVRSRRASPGVAKREHDRAHREVDLPGERDRGERERGPHEPPPLEREQPGGQQERDQPEEVPGRLPEPVGREREDETADERRAADEPERPQPPARQRAGGDDREQDDEVVRPDVPEEEPQRPERDPEQPPLQIRRCARLGPEGVRVGPRRRAVLELVARQPESPPELQVVTGRGLAVARRGTRQIAAAGVLHGRPRGQDRAGGVED